jgi:hypothetical protein
MKNKEAHKSKQRIPIAYAKPREIFSDQQESELVVYMKSWSKIDYGLTRNGVRTLVVECVVSNRIDIPINWSKDRRVSAYWLFGFMGIRQPLSILNLESTSLSRLSTCLQKRL